MCRSRSPSLLSCAAACGDEPALDLVGRDSRKRDDLVLRAVTGNDLDVAAAKLERIGEEPDDGVVRASVLGRRDDAHLPAVTVPADDGCARCAGRNTE